MTNPDDNDRHRARRDLEREVAAKQLRKAKARQEGERSAWFGLGMFGLVGWSVAVPALIGVPVDYAENARLTERLGALQVSI